MKTYLLIFLMGAILGVAYDLIHVFFGVLEYSTSTHHFYGQSLLVAPLFGSYGLLGLFAAKKLSAKVELPNPTLGRIFYDAILLLAAHLVNGIFVGQNGLTSIGLLIVALASIALPRGKMERIGYLVFPIVGSLGEAFLIQIGFFKYIYGYPIPYWLPLLWFIASGLFINAISYIIRRTEDIHPS